MVVSKRIIILIIAIALVVLVIELAWAYSAIYKSPSKVVAPARVVNINPTATISLGAVSTNLKVGDQISVTVTLASSALTDGTDVIINYDPKVLEVIQTNNVPITVGSLYSQYPNNKLDQAKGIIAASGISSEKNGNLANGIFGTIVYRAKSAGSTNISVVYSPNKTDESNIIETATGKDILGGVSNLQLNITP